MAAPGSTAPTSVAAPTAGGPLRQQKSNWTAYDRYPLIFEHAAGAAARPAGRRLTVLSYGCSTGEEPHALASHYFPRDFIVGLDVSAAALAKARSAYQGRRIAVDESTPATLRAYGPYDVIFAMSVLCRWPQTLDLEDCSAFYTFGEFADALADLDRNLRVGGLLVVYNANFSVLDAPIAERYEIVKTDGVWKNGFVHRFDRDHKRVHAVAADCIYRKRAAG